MTESSRTDPVSGVSPRPGSTSDATIARHAGPDGFRRLYPAAGEPQQVRTDLVSVDPGPPGDTGSAMFRLLHLTDFQLADLASPTRLEFLQSHADDPAWAEMLPSYRPQEFSGLALIEAMARTIRAVVAEECPIDLVLTTGDNADNAQHNELADVIAILDGGRRIHPFGSADPLAPPSVRAATGEHAPAWAGVPNAPVHRGAATRWAEPFESTGFGVPWIACFGNHDALVQGRVRPDEALTDLVTGDRKPTAEPAAVESASPGDEPRPIDSYVADPLRYSGEGIGVAPDPARAPFTRADFVRAQRTGGAAGLVDRPADDDRAYFVEHPHPGVALIVLDSTNPGGYAGGSIGADQLQWLEETLRSVHSRYRDRDGREQQSTARDQAVIVCSHHGAASMDNTHVATDADGSPLRDQDLPRAPGSAVAEMLARFDNVVLWLSGHIHRNQVRPVRTAGSGYWEVTTSAMIDWPCQARTVDLIPDGDVLRIRCRQIDHRAHLDPALETDPVLEMAAVGRRLAANVDDGVGGPDAEGEAGDRNVDLLVPLNPALRRELNEAATVRAR